MKWPPAVIAVASRFRRPLDVTLHTLKGVWDDGFTHAGNLAYLSLLTLFPFFIVVAAVAGSLGRTDDGLRAVYAFLQTVPPDVAKVLAQPIADVIGARGSGGLLTLGLIVTLWTVSGFIETIRELIRRSYQATASHPVWRYRASSVALIIGAVVLMLIAFALQVVLTAAEQFVYRILPWADDIAGWLGISRLAPGLALFAAIWLIFYSLTPGRYRLSCPIWPGALLSATIWVLTTMALPWFLSQFGSYDATYGALGGVIVALLFFYIIGLGLVFGAHLNAALALVPKAGHKAGPDTAAQAAE